MTAPSLTYTLTNGQTADASQVMQNFNDVLNGVTDGTKDLSISALTCAGTATLNGHVNLGNSSADDLVVTASLASALPIKTNNTYAIGSATLGLEGLFLGNGGAGATCKVISASHATTRTYTIPDCSAAASFVMSEASQTIAGTKTFSGQLIGKGTATDDDAASGYFGEHIVSVAGSTSFTTGQYADLASITLPAGDYDVSGWTLLSRNADTFTSVNFEIGLSNASGNSNDRLTAGDTWQYSNSAFPTTFATTTMHIGPIRVTSDGTNLKVGNQAESAGTSGTALKLKIYVGERSVGTAARVYGTIRARRVR